MSMDRLIACCSTSSSLPLARSTSACTPGAPQAALHLVQRGLEPARALHEGGRAAQLEGAPRDGLRLEPALELVHQRVAALGFGSR